MASDTTNQQLRLLSTKHVLSASAAASLMLAGAPGLAQATQVSPPVPAVVAQAPRSVDRRHASRRFQSALRLARRQLEQAASSAHQTFRAAVAVHVHKRSDRTGSGADAALQARPVRRAAAQEFGEAILPAKVVRDEALDSAHAAYIAAVESARVEYLVAAGASASTIATARYEHAVHIASAAYQAQVRAARRVMRTDARDARSELRASLVNATHADGAEAAHRIFRNATTDTNDVFRVRVTAARNSFATHIHLAKTALRAAMSMRLAPGYS